MTPTQDLDASTLAAIKAAGGRLVLGDVSGSNVPEQYVTQQATLKTYGGESSTVNEWAQGEINYIPGGGSNIGYRYDGSTGKYLGQYTSKDWLNPLTGIALVAGAGLGFAALGSAIGSGATASAAGAAPIATTAPVAAAPSLAPLAVAKGALSTAGMVKSAASLFDGAGGGARLAGGNAGGGVGALARPSYQIAPSILPAAPLGSGFPAGDPSASFARAPQQAAAADKGGLSPLEMIAAIATIAGVVWQLAR